MSTAAATGVWRRIERFPGHPEHDEYVLGERENYRGLVAHIRPFESAGERTWSLTLEGCGAPTIQWIRTVEKAQEIGLYLYEALLPEVQAQDAAHDARLAEQHARSEAGRPAREAAERKLARAVASAPVVQAYQCGECNDLFVEPQDAPVYECSRCGGNSHERRCDDCNIFTAKIANLSCPECEAAFDPDGAATVPAALVDGHLYPKRGET